MFPTRNLFALCAACALASLTVGSPSAAAQTAAPAAQTAPEGTARGGGEPQPVAQTSGGGGAAASGAAASTQPAGTIPTPWFANEAVREELGLTEQQFDALIQNYNELYRQQLLQGAQGTQGTQGTQATPRTQASLQQTYLQQLRALLPNQECSLRFDQLHRQYLAYVAFADPEVQDLLNLSLRQRRRLNGLAIRWERRMEEIKLAYYSNPHLASMDFVRLQADAARVTRQILDRQQLAAWETLTGGAFAFPLECYFEPLEPVVR